MAKNRDTEVPKGLYLTRGNGYSDMGLSTNPDSWLSFSAKSSGTVYASALVVSMDIWLPCGCDVFGNPNGFPQSLGLSELNGIDNRLVLSFQPQSFCNYFFTVQRLNFTSGNLTSLSIPVVEAYSPDRGNLCSVTPSYQVLVAYTTWKTAGRNQTYCLVPLAQKMCPGCLTEYIPADGGTSPNIQQCTSIFPAYWFIVDGIVYTAGGADGIMSPVQYVTIVLQVQIPADNAILPQINQSAAAIPPYYRSNRCHRLFFDRI